MDNPKFNIGKKPLEHKWLNGQNYGLSEPISIQTYFNTLQYAAMN